MSETYEMPMWSCPACEKEQQADDYYDLSQGSSLLCQHCEQEFTVTFVETNMSVTIEAHS